MNEGIEGVLAVKMSWLKKGGKSKAGKGPRSGREPAGPTVQDLITLRRWEEAEARLLEAIEHDHRDLRSRRLLADVYLAVGRQSEAVEEFSQVVAAWTQDGFHDRALALLARVRKLVPSEDRTIGLRIDEVEAGKRSERLRVQVREIFAEDRDRRGTAKGALAIEIDRCWNQLARWSVMKELEGEQLRRLFSGLQLVRFNAGEWVARRGAKLERLFVLLDGEIDVVTGKDGSIVVRAITPGESFGEAALLERRRWPADYRAKGITPALSLGRRGLEKAIIGNSSPKELLDALRSQGNDRDVRGLLRTIERR